MDKFSNTKLYIGPMSKNIIDTIIEYSYSHNKKIGLIPSRRQIENTGGYVNNWKTEEFNNYVNEKKINCKKLKPNTYEHDLNNIVLERDHGGPGQGLFMDDGLESLTEDCNYFDIIHIDPWKSVTTFEDGCCKTFELIKYCYLLNPNIYFEISTEEAIRPFTIQELDFLIIYIKERLDATIFNRIIYLVIQSGTALKEGENIGCYNDECLIKMIALSKKYNLLSKEHNGDWISNTDLENKFKLGLDAINIAPEFGMIETKVILSQIDKQKRTDLFELFYNICYKSNKWVKWVSSDFIPFKNKRKLIEICGHYVFSNDEFKTIKMELGDSKMDSIVKKAIEGKLDELYKLVN